MDKKIYSPPKVTLIFVDIEECIASGSYTRSVDVDVESTMEISDYEYNLSQDRDFNF